MRESDDTKAMVQDNDCCTNKVEFLEIKTEINIEEDEERQVKREDNERDEDANKNDDPIEELSLTDYQIPKLEIIVKENLSDEETSDNVSKVSKQGDEENNLDDTRKTKANNEKMISLHHCEEQKLDNQSLQYDKLAIDSAVCEVPIKTEILFTETTDFVNTSTYSQLECMNPNDDPLDTAKPFTRDTTIFKAQPLKAFKCKICSKSFHNKSTFRRHVWEHSHSFSCSYCSFKTHRKVQLNAHVNTQHTKSVSYVCDYCNHTSYRKEYLIKHINSKHTRDIYYTCSFCAFKTCQKGYLSRHINIKHTHKVVYNCTYCQFATCIKNSLTSHVNAEHTKSVAYKCSHCSYKTFYKSYYNKHVKARHRDIPNKL